MATQPARAVAGAEPALQTPAGAGRAAASQGERELVQLSAGEMVVLFDKSTGSLYSIKQKGDPLDTEFMGNAQNTLRHGAGGLWTGTFVTATWEPAARANARGRWRRELTDESADIRSVTFDGTTFAVKYQGKSANEQGLKSYDLAMSFRMDSDGALLWDVELENSTGRVLEIGELAFPLRVNDDYEEAYRGTSVGEAIQRGNVPLMQQLIHEKKVFAHHFIGGHSSYALIQRPAGTAPFLLFHTLEDTPLECCYKSNPAPRVVATAGLGDEDQGWVGTDLLAIHSWGTKFMRRWWNSPWVNGHTSLLLKPGQKKSYRFCFAFIRDYPDIRAELFKAGNLGLRILPGMVVPEDTEVYVEAKSKSDLENIEVHSDGVSIKQRRRSGDKTLLTLSFKFRGQKSLKLVHGNGRWTYLHFYCVEDFEQLVKARGKFIAEREFYENPSDPFHRNHMLLPYDYRRGSVYDDDDEVWQVGGSDEPGFSEPLFLAEKNVHFPARDEIQKLELYVSDCLFKFIQNPETYEVRASLYWKDRLPSAPWGNWSRRRSESTGRAYNYVHAANIYHALYRIGKEYGLVTHRPPVEYLKMSGRTCAKWFNTGSYRHVGLMGGSNALDILADLKKENLDEEHRDLATEIQKCTDIFLRDPYPYSSEMALDETAQEQVYFFTRASAESGNPQGRDKNLRTVRVLEALRGGDQPVWFRYGQDLFAHPELLGQVTCWYSESLNGLALLKAYDDTGDPELLLKGYPGVLSVMRNVLADGMGFGWFICAPGIFTHEPPKTFESGPGLWAFMRAAKAYVVNDEAFGLIGCGCAVEQSAGQIKATPRDGVKKRLRFVTEKIDLKAAQGELASVTLRPANHALELRMTDSTGLAKLARLRITGLPDGQYKVSHGKGTSRVRSTGALELEVPIKAAGRIAVSPA